MNITIEWAFERATAGESTLEAAEALSFHEHRIEEMGQILRRRFGRHVNFEDLPPEFQALVLEVDDSWARAYDAVFGDDR